jgi:hypothetical protein
MRRGATLEELPQAAAPGLLVTALMTNAATGSGTSVIAEHAGGSPSTIASLDALLDALGSSAAALARLLRGDHGGVAGFVIITGGAGRAGGR